MHNFIVMRTAPLLLALAALLSACGDTAPACSAVLPATHLVNGLCTGASGYCFYDHDTPF